MLGKAPAMALRDSADAMRYPPRPKAFVSLSDFMNNYLRQ